ncbi:MAG: putative Ig domain-containing protein [Gemmataceae bacterium]|nr:putative Ig domain-containing protein [Gemmataceae bacterium]
MDWSFSFFWPFRRRATSTPPSVKVRFARRTRRSYLPAVEHLEPREVPAIIVPPANQPPNLTPITAVMMDESSPMAIVTEATDLDPGQTLTFSLMGAPAWASIDSGSGVVTLAPGEVDGPGVYTFIIQVTDNGTPALSDQESVTVTVNEVNTAPVLNPIADRSIDEGSTLSFVVTAADGDAPANGLTYRLDPGAPAGASIDASSGEFTFTPTEAQGPGTYTIAVRVTDDGSPALSATQTFSVTVNEVNAAPTLNPIPDRTVAAGETLTFTATASDPDVPAQSLTYALVGDVPDGASIEASTGVVTWTPTVGQGPGTYVFGVRAVDDGTPQRFNEKFFTVTVTPGTLAPKPLVAPDVYALIGNGKLKVEAGEGVLSNDYKGVGDTLTAMLVQGPTYGKLSFDADGSFSYQPKGGYAGSDYFTYAAVDANGTVTAPVQVELVVFAQLNPPTKPVDVTVNPEVKGKTELSKEFKFANNQRTGTVQFLSGVGLTEGKQKLGGSWQQLRFVSDQNDAKNFHWIQFVTRSYKYDGKEFNAGTTYPTRFGEGKYGNANWVVDSNDPKQIFYDFLPGASRTVTQNELSVYDEIAPPGYQDPPGVKAENLDPKKFVSYASFDSYLVWDNQGKLEIVFHVSWRWEFTAQFNKDKTSLVGSLKWVVSGEATNKLADKYNVKTFPGLTVQGKAREYPNPFFVPKN